jgi:hypothetical protein
LKYIIIYKGYSMKKIKGLALAAITALSFSITAQAQQSADEEYACTVLICMANPAGPMAVAQCVPAITKYFKSLMKFRPPALPNCSSRGETDMTRGVEEMLDLDGGKVSRPYAEIKQGDKVLNRTYLDGMDAKFVPYPVAQ